MPARNDLVPCLVRLSYSLQRIYNVWRCTYKAHVRMANYITHVKTYILQCMASRFLAYTVKNVNATPLPPEQSCTVVESWLDDQTEYIYVGDGKSWRCHCSNAEVLEALRTCVSLDVDSNFSGLWRGRRLFKVHLGWFESIGWDCRVLSSDIDPGSDRAVLNNFNATFIWAKKGCAGCTTTNKTNFARSYGQISTWRIG